MGERPHLGFASSLPGRLTAGQPESLMTPEAIGAIAKEPKKNLGTHDTPMHDIHNIWMKLFFVLRTSKEFAIKSTRNREEHRLRRVRGAR